MHEVYVGQNLSTNDIHEYCLESGASTHSTIPRIPGAANNEECVQFL